MTISTRTPEGFPHRCPICGEITSLEPSNPGGDSCCPACGQLLWWFKDRLGEEALFARNEISPASSIADDLRVSSLALVELVMELEEEFDINIPDDVAERLKTVEDVIRYIRRHRRG